MKISNKTMTDTYNVASQEAAKLSASTRVCVLSVFMCDVVKPFACVPTYVCNGLVL